MSGWQFIIDSILLITCHTTSPLIPSLRTVSSGYSLRRPSTQHSPIFPCVNESPIQAITRPDFKGSSLDRSSALPFGGVAAIEET